MLLKWKNLLRSCREVKKFLHDETRQRFLDMQILLEECEWDKELQFEYAIYIPGEGWDYNPYKVNLDAIEQEVEKLLNKRLADMWNRYDKLVKSKHKSD